MKGEGVGRLEDDDPGILIVSPSGNADILDRKSVV